MYKHVLVAVDLSDESEFLLKKAVGIAKRNDAQLSIIHVDVNFSDLYTGLIDLDLSVLRRKGKTRQPKETRGTFRIGTSIAKRPKEVRNRETFGHWELDTVVSSRGKSKGCLATFLERKTRFYLAFKIPNRTAKSTFSAIEQLCNLFPKEALKTFTSDREKSLPAIL